MQITHQSTLFAVLLLFVSFSHVFGYQSKTRTKRSTYLLSTRSTPEIKSGHLIHLSCPDHSIIDVRSGSTRGRGNHDEMQECVNQVFEKLYDRCDNHQYCNVRVENSLCEASRHIYSVRVSDYRCQGDCSFLRPLPPKCLDVDCSTTTKKWCIKCSDIYLYKLVYQSYHQSSCEDKCSWANRWCWPGRCPNDLASNCRCMNGFKVVQNTYTARCQPVTKPVIESCLTSAFSNKGSQTMSTRGTRISPTCSLQTDFYGRFQVMYFNVDFYATFIITTGSLRRPAFVSRELFGVTAVTVRLHKRSITGQPQHLKVQTVKSPLSTNPEPNFNRKINVSSSEHLNNGERLCLTFEANGGGYLVSRNLETHREVNVSYDTTTISRSLCYIYDDHPPIHCSELHSCNHEPLQLSTRLTRSRNIIAHFAGWLDPIPIGSTDSLASGIESYEIRIYEVTSATPTTLMRDRSSVGATYKLSKNTTSVSIELPEKNPMLYAILLEVKDFADNVHHARRFVLYDNTSVIKINSGYPLRVITASNETRYRWQINHGKLCYDWDQRYYNDPLKSNNPFYQIERDTYNKIVGRYEQTSGILPTNGTENVYGVTKFYYSIQKDGYHIMSGSVVNISLEKLCIQSTIVDGDEFTLELQANDIMNHKLNDTVSVFIDRSVPEITDIWLSRDGTKQLYVHHSTDLSKMVIHFKAFDTHSGIREIKWAFGIYENRTVIIKKNLGVINVESLDNSSSIYCPKIGNCNKMQFGASLDKLKNENKHMGDHNKRYFFTIEAMNHAFLRAYNHIDILVDDSPPEVGVVIEGPVGAQDIDYTSNEEITIHWHDFIDHESGIKLYKVVLSNECQNELEYLHTGIRNGTIVEETVQTSTKLSFPNGKGQYFVSVIALNHAMSPSKVVCSDGIIFDKTFPKISNISIKHGKIKESVACSEGEAWLIKNNLIKVPLHSSVCSGICKNSSDDVILTTLTMGHKTNSNATDISEFICQNMPLYSDHVIYVPSDLLDLSWDILEDRSQISNIYIGLGKDRSTMDDPDIQGYIKVHHPSRYIQHHPGLLGEDMFYIFLRVINRAGLETTVWLGPVLADETPPVCPTSLQPLVKGNKVVIEWTKSEVFDPEQSEEIGQVMFRFGTGNSFITPFQEWNIENNNEECGTNHQCIKYPIKRLQKFDSKDGSVFYAQLYFYNYAGHYCSITTLSFYLPSVFPPRAGVIFDVLPDSKPTYQDVDFIIDSNQFCVAWNGFDHHENVRLQLGLGTSPGIDDSIPFQDVPSNKTNFICKSLPLSDKIKKYFATVKASCSGGETLSFSDGFVLLNKTNILKSMFVYRGENCVTTLKLRMINRTSHYEIESYQPLKYGKIYSIFATENITINDPSVLTMETRQLSEYMVFRFVPLRTIYRINMSLYEIPLENINKTNVLLYQCNPFLKSQISQTLIPVHWTFDTDFSEFLTNFKTAICKYHNGKCTKEVVYHNGGKTASFNFTGRFPAGTYKAFVKPCFGNLCLSSASSKTFSVGYSTSQKVRFNSKASINGRRLNVSLTIDEYFCYTNESALIYRYAVFPDSCGQTSISDWKWTVGISLKRQYSVWIDAAFLPYKHSCVCVEPLCSSGIRPKQCSPVDLNSDPNSFEKKTVYDLNLNDIRAKKVVKYQYTANIGTHLRKLHDSELDFADAYVKIGGFIICKPTIRITWYLMSTQDVPTILCSMDDSCVYSMNTTGGFVDFKNPTIRKSKIFYICASSSEFRLCSNGFLVDLSNPSKGVVSIENYNGYVMDGTQLALSWRGFSGNRQAVQLGYQSDIERYNYAIGTSKGADDILPFTNAGLSESIIAIRLDLKPGHAYYVTVRAFNYVNKTVDAFSKHVIYDPSPPTIGVIDVEDSFYGFVAAKTLSIRWFGIEDNESRIRMIEIGIGSHNNSADVIPFREFVDFANIQNEGNFQDGHTYYAILRATNGVGHQSYTVSFPFIIDSSPPAIGHVMETSTEDTVKRDIDYQTDTYSINVTWYGFDDPHSKLSYYKVALGTIPEKDDVIPYTSVGLKTSTTWKYDFIHGVRYYTSVKACNGARLCSTATSNGVVIDKSPPVPGLVVVGDPGRHSRYQSDRKYVHAAWIGFEDPQSGLDHFDVCIGTSKLLCDVMKQTNVQLTSSIVKTNLSMTIGSAHFVTVIACNNVKMCTRRSSESFIVDHTSPNVITKPYIQSSHIEKYKNRTVISDPSFFRVIWKFDDLESPIIRTSISIFSNLNSHVPLDDIVLIAVNEYTVHTQRNESLRQGDVYVIKVTACNAAGKCATSYSDEILVDSTPPQIGSFKSPMTYQVVNERILFRVSWFGFFDVQSDIRSYYISVGTSYSSTDVVDKLLILPNGSDVIDNTVIQAPRIDLPDYFVFTIWAVNNAGIATFESKATFNVAPSSPGMSQGSLILQKHSCNMTFCDDKCKLCDCTCGHIGKKCISSKNNVCKPKSSQSAMIANLNIDVLMTTTFAQKTGSSMCVSANWTFSPISISVLKFEYSFGKNGTDAGDGIYNLKVENPWHDVGKRRHAFYCLQSGELIHDTYYIAHVRAWVSKEMYVTATSLPLLIDHTAPVIHKHHPVTDYTVSCGEDVDYIKSNSTVYGCWDGVFADDESGIIEYFVSLGSSEGADDIISMKTVGLATRTVWRGVDFEPGTRYYTNVIALNGIGLQTDVSSDGFLLDDTPPTEGIIFNTRRYGNKIFQSVTETIFFSWHGFDDEYSFIQSYMIAFDVNNQVMEITGSLLFNEIGISNEISFPGNLVHGDVIMAHVKAVDAAGHASNVVSSKPLIIDGTPPGSFACNKFDTVRQDSINNISQSYLVSDLISTNRNDILKLKIEVDEILLGFNAYFTNGDMTMLLPFVTNADRSVVCDFTYLVEKSGLKNTSLHLYEVKPGTSAKIAISTCSEMRKDIKLKDTIIAEQISQDEISVCVNTIDAESGIRRISIGVGSVQDGEEILPMRSMPSHRHDVIKGNFTHGMTVFVRAIAENHAGMTSDFKSNPFIFDMTPPTIMKKTLKVEYVHENNDTATVITANWIVVEEESRVDFCEYCIGSAPLSCDTVGKTRTGTLHYLKSDPLILPHGSAMYVTVHCVNIVQLIRTAHFGPFIVSYHPPLSTNSQLHVVHDVTAGSCNFADSQGISFYWDKFTDPSGIYTYSAKIQHGNNKAVDWTNVKRKNYIQVRSRSGEARHSEELTLFVRAENGGEWISQSINKTVHADCRKPSLTGAQIKINKVDNSNYEVTWDEVFNEDPIVKNFEIAIGSTDGYTDIVMPTLLKFKSILIVLPEKVNEVYIILSAFTKSGELLTKRQSVIL